MEDTLAMETEEKLGAEWPDRGLLARDKKVNNMAILAATKQRNGTFLRTVAANSH